MRDMARNARFWTWWNGGWVKLTLRPGQRIALATGRTHEEGFTCEAERYEYDAAAGVVLCEMTQWGRDCDGGHEWNCECACAVAALAADQAEDGTPRPAWEKIACGQRDEYAEAAGY